MRSNLNSQTIFKINFCRGPQMPQKKWLTRAEVDEFRTHAENIAAIESSRAAFTAYRTIHSIQKTRGGHENLEFSGTQYCNIMSQ